MILRLLFLLLVLVGLWVNVSELRHSRWVLRTLVEEEVNGLRQYLAIHFVREAWMRSILAFSLLLPSIVGILRDLGYANASLTILSVCSLMTTALTIAVKAIMNQVDRDHLNSMTKAEVARHKAKREAV